jgi:hypothetical protein
VKRVSLAALLAFGVLAFARADEGAYKNLVGMARAAATDRGPDADDAPERGETGPDALKDAVADVPAPRAPAIAKIDVVPGAVEAPVAVSAASSSAVPAAGKPRLWTRLYSTLLPSWRHPSSLQNAFDPAVSTASVRTTTAPSTPSPGAEAVNAGERRGLSELMSVPPAARAQ